jgi:Icc-related predicted phosphoesterase
MTECFFVSDLHGRIERYRVLFDAMSAERPRAVFIGGDIMPHPGARGGPADFIGGFLLPGFARVREAVGESYPRVFIILGNEDPRVIERSVIEAADAGLFSYMHGRREPFGRWIVHGYSYVPPTPFPLKDWERYDVSRSVEPGCISPEEGRRTVDVDRDEVRLATIAGDLHELERSGGFENGVVLFHSPPRDTNLDRLGRVARAVDREPPDVHVGSIAIRRFIESAQPLVTLHGHIHESTRMTGSWRDRIGRTVALSAAHDGPELALVRFDLEDPSSAARELL